MVNFNPVAVYSNELQRHADQWLGHALWYPASNVGEVEIGDVGYILEGRFMRMFNVVTEDGLSTQERPDGFQRLKYPDSLVDRREDYPNDRVIASNSVKISRGNVDVQGGLPGSAAGVGYSLECSSQQGAILHLTAPADMVAVQPNDAFPSYMKAHHRNWLDFMRNVRKVKCDATDVLLVRGHVKAPGWAVAAFKARRWSASARINASVALTQNIGLGLSFLEDGGLMHASHGGPVTSTQSHLTQDEPLLKNQCIFLRYYKIKYRFGLFPEVIRAAAGPAPLPDQPPEEGPQAVLASDDMEVETEVTEPLEPVVLPVDVLLDHILDYSTADIAIASDGEVEMLLGHENPDDIAKYLRIHQPVIIVDEDKVGRLSLESLVLGLQRQRRALAAQDNEEEADAKKHQGLVESQAVEEKAILASGKSLRWLDTVFRDTMEEGVSISSFSISNNSKFVLTGLDNDNIVLWDMYTGQQVLEYNGHEETVLAVAFSPDGTKFVSGGADSKARLWDVETHNSTVLEGHSDWVYCVAWAANGKTIATGSFDYMVYLWEPTGEKRSTLAHNDQVMFVEFSPDSKTLLAVANSAVQLWDVQTGRQLVSLGADAAMISSAKFSHQGDRVVTGSDDGTARIWDVETGSELVILHEHTGPVWSVEFSPDGQYIVSGSLDETITVCDSFSGQNKFTISERLAEVNAVAYSHNGLYIASGDADGLVKLWDASTGVFVVEFHGHQEKVKSVTWSLDDKSLLSSSDDGSIRVWSICDIFRFV